MSPSPSTRFAYAVQVDSEMWGFEGIGGFESLSTYWPNFVRCMKVGGDGHLVGLSQGKLGNSAGVVCIFEDRRSRRAQLSV